MTFNNTSAKRINGFTTVVKQCLLLVVVACLLGWIFYYPVLKSFSGNVMTRIKQLDELRNKADQLKKIQFVDLVTAKNMFDQQEAIFLDARSQPEYYQSSIGGAIGISLQSVIKGEVVVEQLLPDKSEKIITFCNGGESDAGLEMAKELIKRGYTNVSVLGAGYSDWKMAGYPVYEPEEE